jgi:tRNA pseudouridine13 synthase
MAGDLVGALERFPRSYRLERQVLEVLLRSRGNYRKAVRIFSDPVRKLYYSAYQSYLFNRILERRLEECGNDPARLFAGDLAWIHRSGAVFRVVDAGREQPRADALEISPSGPVFGIKMIHPEGLQARIEERVLAEASMLPTTFHQLMPGLHLEGGRRPLRVPVRELRYEIVGADLAIEFFLPKGSYATTFLREIMKKEEVPAGYGPPDEEELRPPGPAEAVAVPTGPSPEPAEVPAPVAETAHEEPDLEADDEPPME